MGSCSWMGPWFRPLDSAGNRTSVTTAAGTESYSLDALSRITSVTYADGSTASYTYDAGGNRLTRTQGGQVTNYTYDNAGQLTSDGTNSYTYDANGNQLTRGSDAFTWDYDNRLTSATVGGATTTYQYDADGVRQAKTVGSGTPINYLWDRESGLPLLVDDGSTAYVHADGLLENISGSTDTHYLGDALGSVRGLTDGTGSLTATADYDVFGALRGGAGTGTFGFTGEQYDAETGYTYLRARYYDPTIGRFASADSVQPNAPGTQGYNLYAYVANNPSTWVDPSGYTAVAAGTVPLPTIDAAAAAMIAQRVMLPVALVAACLSIDWCREQYILGVTLLAVGGLSGIGGGAIITFALVACALDVGISSSSGGNTRIGCYNLMVAAYNTLRQSNAPVAPTSTGEGAGVQPTTGTGATTGGGIITPSPSGGGGTATPPNPFQNNPWPPRGPNGKFCLSDVLAWLLEAAVNARVLNPGGVGGPETWTWHDSNGTKWEVTIKREGSAHGAPGSEAPRVSIKNLDRAERLLPSYYDPETNSWSGQRSPKAHLPLERC